MNRIIFIFCLILIVFSTKLLPQQNSQSWKIFDDSHIARVDITINPDTLQWLYDNVLNEDEFYAKFRFQNNWIDETVDSIGFRLRGNTSRHSQKKSFKVSFNTFISGREFYGVDKLNLNGEHNDPSIIRSKLSFDTYKKIGVLASRANHVEVYINNKYYGLYISVEHIDDEFLQKNFADDTGNLWKCLYPADLQYLGDNQQTYINLNDNGRPVYELKSNENLNDFSQLVRFIKLINNTPSSSFADSIESFFNVSGFLQYLAVNVLTGSWDDYRSLMNNYYLYHDPTNDIFHLIPYDYDNTFGIDWFNINWSNANPYNFPKVNQGPRPLAENILAVPQYRNLYTHFLEFYREKVFLLNHWEERIDSLRQMISSSALEDTFRTKDYNFTYADFFNSYSAGSFSNQHVKNGLKQFINLRNNSLPGQLNYVQSVPIVYSINNYPKNPRGEDSIYIYASCFSNNGLNEVLIHFVEDGSSTVQVFPMNYSPIVNTKIAEENDRYIGVIPPLGAGKSGKFTIYIKDNNNQSLSYPRKGGINIKTLQFLDNDIVINEFLADNDNSNPDPAGQFDDWVELYNPTQNPILLTGRYMTDNPNNLTKWKIVYDSLYINPGEYLLIWCDNDLNQPGIHASFALSKDGEYIALVETDGITIIDSITFGPQQTDISMGRSPDASSNWIFMTPTPGLPNIVSSVNNELINSKKYLLSQNYPNPFNPSTTIEFSLPSPLQGEGSGVRFVSIKVYDILGNEVATLVNEYKSAGNYSVEFKSEGLSSGVYYYVLSSDGFVSTKKMLLLK